MRRRTFFLTIALAVFGIGSLFSFGFYLKYEDRAGRAETTVRKIPVSPINPVQSFSIEDTERFFPADAAETRPREKSSCHDEAISPVWELIEKDDYFLERGGLPAAGNCAEMFEVFNFDLDQNGAREILLRGKSPDLCGAVGNCQFWIFEKKDDKYRKILSAADYVDITEMGGQITKRKTNGYFDVLLKGHWNAADTMYLTYRFNGRRYVPAECSVNYYVRGAAENPRHEFISCREHARREGY